MSSNSTGILRVPFPWAKIKPVVYVSKTKANGEGVSYQEVAEIKASMSKKMMKNMIMCPSCSGVYGRGAELSEEGISKRMTRVISENIKDRGQDA